MAPKWLIICKFKIYNGRNRSFLTQTPFMIQPHPGGRVRCVKWCVMKESTDRIPHIPATYLLSLFFRFFSDSPVVVKKVKNGV